MSDCSLFEDSLEPDNSHNRFVLNREMLLAGISPILSSISLNDFRSIFIDEVSAVMEYFDLFSEEKTGQKISLLFNPHRLDTKTKDSKHSIYGALNQPSFLSGLARAMLFKKGKCKELLYQAIQLGINGVGYVNEFPPHVARKICKKYGLSKDSNILDPCAGWGGRMIGVSTVCNNYTAFEPSIKTYDGLQSLSTFIKRLKPDFSSNLYNIPFEESKLNPMTFDLAITSPPYFDTEEYSKDSGDSASTYKTFDSWIQGFYLPMIEKTMEYLKPNGVFVLNIGSRKYPLNDVLIESFGKSYKISKESSWLLSGCGGLKSSLKEGETFYHIKKLS